MDAPEIPMHMPISVYRNAALSITATRISGSIIQIVYHAQDTQDEVLMLHGRMDGSPSQLVRCNASFWDITVDGRSATEEDLDALVMAPDHQIDVDPDARSIKVTRPA